MSWLNNWVEAGRNMEENEQLKALLNRAIDRVAQSSVELATVTRERDQARDAANWLFRFVDQSQWTHFDENDLTYLEQFGDWLGNKS